MRCCKPFVIFALTIVLTIPACKTGRGTGTLAGGGVGALVGGVAGGWQWAAIGAAAGAAGGYIIGNEADQAKARRSKKVPLNELQPLAGTKWKLIELESEVDHPFKSFTADFRTDGTVRTVKVTPQGERKVSTEKYRFAGDILIINKTDYVLNFHWKLEGNTLTIWGRDEDAKKWHLTFQKIS